MNGLYLRFREIDRIPSWRFRYKLAGKSRTINLGTYADLSLSKARELTRELSARVSLGYDVAGEKQERKAEALAKIEAEKNAIKVSDLMNSSTLFNPIVICTTLIDDRKVPQHFSCWVKIF